MVATSTRQRPRRYRDIHPTRRGLVLSWWSFTVTFGALRLLTWLIHVHVAGLGNVSAGGVHIHHYVWGILILAVVGSLGLVERTPSWRVWMGLAFGFGLALVVDEAALLVELKDVYWDRQGAASVAVAILLIGVVGSLLVMTRAPHIDSDAWDAPESSKPPQTSEVGGATESSSSGSAQPGT